MRRWSWMIAAAFLASCRAKNHEDALDPVQAFVREAKSGTTTLKSYQSVCDDVVDEESVVRWSESMKSAVKDHGRDVRYEIVSQEDRQARVRLTFPSGATATVVLRERWTGWWITSMDLESMTAAPAERGKPFAAGGGSDYDSGGG